MVKPWGTNIKRHLKSREHESTVSCMSVLSVAMANAGLANMAAVITQPCMEVRVLALMNCEITLSKDGLQVPTKAG